MYCISPGTMTLVRIPKPSVIPGTRHPPALGAGAAPPGPLSPTIPHSHSGPPSLPNQTSRLHPPPHALPSFTSNPNSQAHAPAPNPSGTGPGLPALAAGPHRSVRIPENSCDQTWHLVRRSQAERARGTRPGGDAPVTPFRCLAARRPSCCVVPVAGGQSAQRGRGLPRPRPSPCCWGGWGGASRRQFRRSFWREKAWGILALVRRLREFRFPAVPRSAPSPVAEAKLQTPHAGARILLGGWTPEDDIRSRPA